MEDPGWVDTHCHLYMLDEPPGPVLDRAAAAGVRWVVCPGIDLETSLAARSVASAEPGRVLWTAGLHPHEASRWGAEQTRLRSLAVAASAVGECGLDYYRDLSPRDDQRAALRDQLELAAALEKPVVLHCRDAFSDLYDALEIAQLGVQAVLHCWTGGPRWTRRFNDLGVTFSFAGPVTFATGDTVRRAAAEAPPTRTMVETDTPFLSPPPHRDERNEPARLPLIGAALAEVWGLGEAEVARNSTVAAVRVFGQPAA